MFDISIPKIDDVELMERYSKIKPVISINGKKYYIRDYSLNELKNQSYIWNALTDIEKEADCLKPLVGKDFYCIHKYGHPILFKPSISEVLAQIETKHFWPNSSTCAFEIIEYPDLINQFGIDSVFKYANSNNYHVSKVRLYENR